MTEPAITEPVDPPKDARRLSKLAVASLLLACISVFGGFLGHHFRSNAFTAFESCADWLFIGEVVLISPTSAFGYFASRDFAGL